MNMPRQFKVPTNSTNDAVRSFDDIGVVGAAAGCILFPSSCVKRFANTAVGASSGMKIKCTYSREYTEATRRSY